MDPSLSLALQRLLFKNPEGLFMCSQIFRAKKNLLIDLPTGCGVILNLRRGWPLWFQSRYIFGFLLCWRRNKKIKGVNTERNNDKKKNNYPFYLKRGFP